MSTLIQSPGPPPDHTADTADTAARSGVACMLREAFMLLAIVGSVLTCVLGYKFASVLTRAHRTPAE